MSISSQAMRPDWRESLPTKNSRRPPGRSVLKVMTGVPSAASASISAPDVSPAALTATPSTRD